MRNPLLFLSALIAISGCGEDEDLDEGQKNEAAISATCARACSRAASAQCAEGNADCMADCKQAIESSPSACSRELDAFTACVTQARFTCDANGEAEAKECTAQLAAWARCQDGSDARDGGVSNLPGRDAGAANGGDAALPSTVDSGTPSLPTNDAGTPHSDGGTSLPASDAGSDGGVLGGTLSCTPRAADDACGTCFKASCCDEIEACGPDCVALVDCITECTSETCVNTCYAAYPDGVDAFALLASCTEDNCEAECSDTTGATEDIGLPGDAGTAPDLSQICLPSPVPDGVCTDPRQPVGHDCPLGKPYPDCTLLPDIANVYCCSR